MQHSSTTSLRGAARLLVAVATLGLAACGEASTAPAVTPSEAAPALNLVGTIRALRYTQSCTGTTCTFNASTSVGFTSFRWTFVGGNPSSATTQVATTSYVADGSYMVVLQGSYPATATTRAGTAQVYTFVVCKSGVCF